jgi:hypothetical protein
LKARDKCPTVTVANTNGYAIINVASDIEAHNPIMWAMNPRTNKLEKANQFFSVGKAGLYDRLIPVSMREWALSIDDAYGVIEEA